VPEVERVVVLAGPHAILRLGGTIFTINLRNRRRQAISHYRPNEHPPRYGPWVSAGRVLWVESYGDTKPHSLIRSAPLPDPHS